MENKTDNTLPEISDFPINELLYAVASSISATYTRMCVHFSDRPFAKIWNEEALFWYRYSTNIHKMSFKTYEEGKLEIQRITKINRGVLESEQKLLQKNY